MTHTSGVVLSAAKDLLCHLTRAIDPMKLKALLFLTLGLPVAAHAQKPIPTPASVIGWVVGRPEVAGISHSFWPVLAAGGAVCFVFLMFVWPGEVLRAVALRLLPHERLRKLHELAEGWPGLLRTLGGRRRWIVGYSLMLWLTHLVQIWLFTFALSVMVPFTVSTSLSAVALVAGQIPFTIAGLGARDVVLVVLLASYMTPESAAAMGVLISTRGLLPPLLGLPILRPYLSSAVEDAQRWRQAGTR